MAEYRRGRVVGGTYFFTVVLGDRSGELLVEHIELLRDAVRHKYVAEGIYPIDWMTDAVDIKAGE